MGQAKRRSAEIDQLKDERFIICQVGDENGLRCMSMKQVYPFIDLPADQSTCEYMLNEYVNNNRPVNDVMDKVHFFNWAYNYESLKSDSKKFWVDLKIVERKEFELWNQLAVERHNAKFS